MEIKTLIKLASKNGRLNVMEYVNSQYAELKNEISAFDEKPRFDIYQYGDNPASNKYVGNKIKRCNELGIEVTLTKVINEEEGVKAIDEFKKIENAKMIQYPCPSDWRVAATDIPLKYDVDGLGYASQCALHIKDAKLGYLPCTAKGVLDYIKHIADKQSLEGASVLIINRSELVGLPLFKLLTMENATVTLAHSKTKNIDELVASGNYDIIISGTGVGKRFKPENVRTKLFVDVTTAFKGGKLCGDLDITKEDKAKFLYTPVPGGVGQLTVLSLMKNIANIK